MAYGGDKQRTEFNYSVLIPWQGKQLFAAREEAAQAFALASQNAERQKAAAAPAPVQDAPEPEANTPAPAPEKKEGRARDFYANILTRRFENAAGQTLGNTGANTRLG